MIILLLKNDDFVTVDERKTLSGARRVYDCLAGEGDFAKMKYSPQHDSLNAFCWIWLQFWADFRSNLAQVNKGGVFVAVGDQKKVGEFLASTESASAAGGCFIPTYRLFWSPFDYFLTFKCDFS